MKPIEPSSEQRDAIFARGSLAVRAGAGSGKTEVLARRFVALLAGHIDGIEPISPEQIAAITFTEKATYDMRRRIAEVLERELAIAEGERAALLTRAKRLMPLARISTIHAFCARILRENPLEARLDPDFTVLDEAQSRTLLEKHVEELIIAALRRGDRGALHLVGARGLRGGAYREGAIEIVARLATELHRRGKDAAWLLQATDSGCAKLREQASRIREFCVQVVKLIEELRRAKLTPKAAQTMNQFESNWPRFRRTLESFDADSEPAELEILRELCDSLPGAHGKAIKEIIKKIGELVATNGTRLGLDGALIRAYGAYRAIEPTLDTCAFAAEIVDEIERRKLRDGVVTFDDLLGHTFRLLRENPAVAKRCRQNLRALLVDEYQDTDPMQDAIVRLLTGPHGEIPPPDCFIVGDEKQSIYRFRGADVSVFKRAREDSSQSLALTENRRSVPSLLRFVNALSASVMGGESEAPFWVRWDKSHLLREVRAEIPSDEPTVEIMVWSDSSAGDSSDQKIHLKRQIEARAIANRCRQILDRGALVADADGQPRVASPCDIAILMRSFEDVQIYERALDEAGLPCYTVKGRGFYACREILDIAELLAAITDPLDSMALTAALRSPFFTLSDQSLMEIALHGIEQKLSIAAQFNDPAASFKWLPTGRDDAVRALHILQELRAMRESSSLTSIIERALELTDFETVMIAQTHGAQRVANVRKLLEIAREFESRAFFTLSDFIEHLRWLTVDQPKEAQAQLVGEDEDVIRLMTIHQAKGLEFPIVVVADIGRRMPNLANSYIISMEHGLLMSDTVGSGNDEMPHPLIDVEKQLVTDQERAESARLFYVAITRARDRLILSEGPGKQEWSKQLRTFLKDHIAPFLASNENESTVEIAETRVTFRRTQPMADEPISRSDAQAPASPELEDFVARAHQRIGFESAPNQELIASPTALVDFDRCPRQYFFRHQADLPEHDGFAAGRVGSIERGNIAHAVLESIDFDLRGAELRNAIDTAIPICAGIQLTPPERAELAADLIRYVETRPDNERVLAREVPFFMNLAEAGVSLFVRGQIDLIVDEGRTIVVRDYKYARPREDEPSGYEIAMDCYRLAAAETYSGREVRAELLFLRGGPQRQEIKLPDLDASRARLLRIARAILAAQESGEYSRKPQNPDECYRLRCGYVRRCWQTPDG